MHRLRTTLETALAPGRRRDALALALLLTLYGAKFLPQVFVSDGVPVLTLPLSMSYAASTLLFDGWLAKPALRDVVGTAALGHLAYPPGIFLLARASQRLLGDSVLHLNLLLFALQALTPILSYLILRRFTGPLWALLLAWFIAAKGVFIYTIPDYYNQVLILASLWLLLEAFGAGRRRLLVLAGLLCAVNVAFKHNIGLAWTAAAGAFLFFGNLRPAPDRRGPPDWAAISIASVFPLYGAVVTSMLGTWDSVLYFTLPFALLWGWVAFGLARRELALDAAGFLRDAALFAVPFSVVLGLGFVLFAWNIGFAHYYHLLFVSPREDAILSHGVAARGLLYYGTGGRVDVLNPRKAVLLALWFAPFAANLWLALRLFFRRPAGSSDPAELPLTALSVTGAYTLFPLESYFILSTKLCIPAIALTAIVSRRRLWPGAARGAAALLAAGVALPAAKQVRNDARLWAGREDRLTRAPGTAGVYLPKAVAKELQLSSDLIRSAAPGRFYIIGSSSGDMSMYYRLVDCGCANYYTDLREGYLNSRAEDDLIRTLESFPFVVVDKRDLDLWRADPSRANATLRKTLAYVDGRFDAVAAYRRPEGAAFAGLNDFYVMRRR